MNGLQVFKHEQFGEVRTVEVNNEVWFVGKDVTDILGYSNGSRDINRHVDEEDRQNYQNGTLESNRGLTIINESGLYSLVLNSKLESAKRFRRWVTKEVIPTIRKHGGYLTETKLAEALLNPDVLIQLATNLKEEQTKRILAEQQIEKDKPKVLFADSVESSTDSILIGQLAKLICQNGYEIGQNRLFKWLRNNGYLVKSGENKNLPTQYSMDRKLMDIKKRTVNNPDGSIRTTVTTKITGKGQIYFINKFLNN